MANHNEGFAAVLKKRRERLEEIIGHTQAMANGLEIPGTVLRFIGTEESDNDVLWAYFGDDLDEVAKSFEESDTDGIFQYRTYDLDADKKYVPVFKVARWVEIESN